MLNAHSNLFWTERYRKGTLDGGSPNAMTYFLCPERLGGELTAMQIWREV